MVNMHALRSRGNRKLAAYISMTKDFSISLLVLVNADYKCVWIELDGKGHMSDTCILRFYATLSYETIGLLPSCPLTARPDDNINMPFFYPKG